MSDLRGANHVLSDFLREVTLIHRHVSMADRRLTVTQEEVSRLRGVLQRWHVTDTQLPEAAGSWGELLDQSALAALRDALSPCRVQVHEAAEAAAAAFAASPKPQALSLPYGTCRVLAAVADTFARELADGGATATTKWSAELARLQVGLENLERARQPGSATLDPDEVLREAEEVALYLVSERKASELAWAAFMCAEIDQLAELLGAGALLNTRRWAFIALMSIFEAAVFDLVAAALRRAPFRLVGKFGRTDAVKYGELRGLGSFDEFRDWLVSRELDGVYIRQVLFVLHRLGVSLVDTQAGQTFAHLVELVKRRNLYLHNRGIVDDEYLEANADGAPCFNIDSFALGDSAPVDQAYWDRAHRLCVGCVRGVKAWVEQLPLQP